MRIKVILVLALSWVYQSQTNLNFGLSLKTISLKAEIVLNTPPQKSLNSKSGELNFLLKYNGKYPFEIKLLSNPTLKKRLQQLLGVQQYKFVDEIMEVQIPIEVKDGLFYAEGMQAHSGGDPSAVIMADISKDILFVGIFKDGKATFFAEENAELPLKLKEWAHF